MSDPGDLDVEKREHHAERPGFRITELRIGPTQQVPWHCHTKIEDTFYVLDGRIRVSLRDPDEEWEIEPGDTRGPVRPGRAHRVTNAGHASATFFVLQGIGDYDFVPLV